MNKVIVLGANGYIGSRLTLSLAQRGYEVIALVDKRFSYAHLNGIEHLQTVEFQLEDLDSLYDNPYIDGSDTLFHMAWSAVNAQLRNEAEEQVKNIMFGLRVLEFAEYHGIKRVVVPGSAAEVSCGDGIITGKEAPAPSDMYSSAKVATRYICQTYASQHQIELVWTLITSVYGTKRNDNNLITYTIQSLLNGEIPQFTGLAQKWDYLHIDDLVNALIALGKSGIGGKVYPVGSGECKTLREYVEMIRDIINPELQLGIGTLPYKNPNKIDNQVLDISELCIDTGFTPQRTFGEGITEVINEYKQLCC